MSIKDLNKIQNTLMDLHEFMIANSDGDESGICKELSESYGASISALKKEAYRIHLRNAKASILRKRKR